jgi:hypothetical protein
MNLLARQPDRDAEYQDEKEFSLEACTLIDVAGLWSPSGTSFMAKRSNCTKIEDGSEY